MTISAKRLQEIDNIPDESIDTSDIPELDENFWVWKSGNIICMMIYYPSYP